MNCIIIDDDKLSCKVLESFVEKTQGLDLKGIFFNPVDALNNTNNFHDIDLLFLDVELPEMSGIDVLSSIDELPHVVVISSNNKYAVDAFDFNVSDFLLKPIKYSRFIKSIQKVVDSVKTSALQDNQEKNDCFFIKKNNAFFKVKYSDICYIESVENYIAFHTIDNKYVIHQTLKSVENVLPSEFRRVHRSYIVNLNKVKVIEDNSLLVEVKKESQKIPIGKVYRDKLLAGIKSFK